MNQTNTHQHRERRISLSRNEQMQMYEARTRPWGICIMKVNMEIKQISGNERPRDESF